MFSHAIAGTLSSAWFFLFCLYPPPSFAIFGSRALGIKLAAKTGALQNNCEFIFTVLMTTACCWFQVSNILPQDGSLSGYAAKHTYTFFMISRSPVPSRAFSGTVATREHWILPCCSCLTIICLNNCCSCGNLILHFIGHSMIKSMFMLIHGLPFQLLLTVACACCKNPGLLYAASQNASLSWNLDMIPLTHTNKKNFNSSRYQ